MRTIANFPVKLYVFEKILQTITELKVNVTPHFSTGQYLSLLTQSTEKSFWIDPLTANNAVYRDSLILRNIYAKANAKMLILRLPSGPFNARKKCSVFQGSLITLLSQFVECTAFLVTLSYGKIFRQLFQGFPSPETVLCCKIKIEGQS